mmetsp:Transcript_5293/g.19061  ORF Transcript_5293/g.19061 Transcript_5293/m.19061 type:complete len:306 (+) Transcript_5293:2536-3453(+)
MVRERVIQRTQELEHPLLASRRGRERGLHEEPSLVPVRAEERDAPVRRPVSANDVHVRADAFELHEAIDGGKLRVAVVLPGDLNLRESHPAQRGGLVLEPERRRESVLDVALELSFPALQALDELVQRGGERRLLRVQVAFVIRLVLRDELGVFRARVRTEARAAHPRELLLEARGDLRGRRGRVLVTPMKERVHDDEEPLLGGRRETRAEFGEKHFQLRDEVRVLVPQAFHDLLRAVERGARLVRRLRGRLRGGLVRLGERERGDGFLARVVFVKLLRRRGGLLRLLRERARGLRHARRRLSSL